MQPVIDLFFDRVWSVSLVFSISYDYSKYVSIFVIFSTVSIFEIFISNLTYSKATFSCLIFTRSSASFAYLFGSLFIFICSNLLPSSNFTLLYPYIVVCYLASSCTLYDTLGLLSVNLSSDVLLSLSPGLLFLLLSSFTFFLALALYYTP